MFRIQSTEVIESKFPLRILRSEIRPDSGGAGQFRGGVGLLQKLKYLLIGQIFSVLSDRNIIPPAGVCMVSRAFQTGTLCSVMVMKLVQQVSRKNCQFLLNISDIVRIETSGGGGWGDPNQRIHQPSKLIRRTDIFPMTVSAIIRRSQPSLP